MNWPMALIVMTAIITVGYVVDALIGNRSAYRQGYTEGYVEGYERGELKQWDGKRKVEEKR